MPGRADLKPYQVEAAKFLINTPMAALWLDMGLGKTVTVLTVLEQLLRKGEIRKVLIVAPLRVALQTWPTEIGKWSHTKSMSYTIIRADDEAPEVREAAGICFSACRGYQLSRKTTTRLVAQAETRARELVRLRLVQEDTQIHIINRESLFWLVEHFQRKFPYDTVVFDESSGLRDIKAKRWLAMAFVRKLIKRQIQLTGTPAPESLIDVFPQAYLLDGGERFGKAITPFREAYFTKNEYTRTYKLKKGYENHIIDKLQGIVLVMKAADYLPTQEPVHVERVMTMRPKEWAQYQKLESDFVLTAPDGTEIEAETAGALWNKLLQYASGAVYDTEKTAHHFHDHKIEELKQIVEESQGQPILVAYWFGSSLARLKKAFPRGKQMDKEGKMQHPWNAGKVPMMFIHPRSAGHGLNIQDGGHILVFFDIPYPLEDYLQTVARLARQGQKHVVTVFYLIMRGTLDMDVVPKLRAKERSQDYLFKRLKLLREKHR